MLVGVVHGGFQHELLSQHGLVWQVHLQEQVLLDELLQGAGDTHGTMGREPYGLHRPGRDRVRQHNFLHGFPGTTVDRMGYIKRRATHMALWAESPMACRDQVVIESGRVTSFMASPELPWTECVKFKGIAK